jgi:Gluconate 2-dehydrogenase subunit 3
VPIKTKPLRVIPDAGVSDRRLTRREIFHRFLGALGAALAGAQVAGAHPIREHLTHPESILDATAKIAGEDWSPAALDRHENETLVILSERILPGSTQAQVNRLIDLFLTVETAENRKNFVGAIAALDAESQKRFQQPAKQLSPAQRDELLTLCSTAKSAKPATDRDSSSIEDDRAPLPGATLRDHFENLKGWIVGAYYSTETGMRELGWTEETYFDALPECTHSEGHS